MACDIGVALFGVGRAGMIHFHNLNRTHRARLVYIVEDDVNKATELVQKYRLKDTLVLSPDNAETAYKDVDVQAVVVCTPTYTHEPIVRASLEHGKAVFCEKPISENAEGTNACYEVAEKANKPLLCSFNRRFDPSIRALRERVRAGELGVVHTIKTCARDHPLPPIEYIRMSGGLFHDCAVHDIDMVCWVLDEFPESVYAVAHAHVKEIAAMKDVDTALITLKFRSGALATLDLSRNSSYGYDQRIEVFGESGVLVSENQRPSELTSYNRSGYHGDALKYSFPQRYADSYVNALEHFFNIIEGLEKLEISKSNTLNVNAVVSACEESCKTGLPVTLSLNNSNQTFTK